MSRSSTKRLGAWPLAADRAVGIALGRREIAAACIAARGRPSLQWARTLPAPEGWLADRPADAHASALRDVLARLVPEARKTFVPVHVALPDALGTIMVFAMDSLPKREPVRRRLIGWRMAQELGVPETAIEVACQDLGAADGKRLVLGQGLHAGWLGLARDALSGAGIVAWSINQAVCFRFNGYHAALTAHRASGAMLAIDADAWAAAIWDPAGRLRFVRARWRPLSDARSGAALDEIAQEFERTVLAYVHGGADRSVARVYLSAAEEERDGMAAALNRRLSTPCVALVSRVDNGREDLSSAAAELAAVIAGAA